MHSEVTFPYLEEKEKIHVLIVDGGMRGEALKYAFERSQRAGVIDNEPFNTSRARLEVSRIGNLVADSGYDLVLVAQENALHAGIVDRLQTQGVPVCGATSEQTRMEASKAFMKQRAVDQRLPTAPFIAVENTTEGRKAGHEYIEAGDDRGVVKDDFLAEGKAAAVYRSKAEGHEHFEGMCRREFNNLGQVIIVEGYSVGRERSGTLSISGETADAWPPAEDHKQVDEGDSGDMGGGSGVITPLDWLDTDAAREQDIETARKLGLLVPGMRGFAFPGYKGDDCLEVNMRTGSTETETHVRRMTSDFLEHVIAIINYNLEKHRLIWSDDYAISIVGMADGYPDSKKIVKGEQITGLEIAQETDDIEIFLGSVAIEDDKVYSNGGRLFAVTATGATTDMAREKALDTMNLIRISGRPVRHRKDIGLRAG